MGYTMFGIGSTELLLLGGVAVLLFGAKRIPELAKGLGKGIKEFKKEMKDESNRVEDKKEN